MYILSGYLSDTVPSAMKYRNRSNHLAIYIYVYKLFFIITGMNNAA